MVVVVAVDVAVAVAVAVAVKGGVAGAGAGAAAAAAASAAAPAVAGRWQVGSAPALPALACNAEMKAIAKPSMNSENVHKTCSQVGNRELRQRTGMGVACL